MCEASGNQAQIDTELRDSRRQGCAVVVGVPVGESAAVEARSAIDEGQSDCRDNEHAEECHLEAGGEECAGSKNEQPEGGCSQRIDHAAIAIKQRRAEENALGAAALGLLVFD